MAPRPLPTRCCTASAAPRRSTTSPGLARPSCGQNFANSQNGDDGYTVSARIIDSEMQTLHVTKGYDNVTGMGTPNGETFLTLLK